MRQHPPARRSVRSAGLSGRRAAVGVALVVLTGGVVAAGVLLQRSATVPRRVEVIQSTPSSSTAVSVATSPSPSATSDTIAHLAAALAAVPDRGSVVLGDVSPVCVDDRCGPAELVRTARIVAAPSTMCADLVAVGSLVPVPADAKVTWIVGGRTHVMTRGVRQTRLAEALATQCRSALAHGDTLVATAPLDPAAVEVPHTTMRIEVRPHRTAATAGKAAADVTMTFAST